MWLAIMMCGFVAIHWTSFGPIKRKKDVVLLYRPFAVVVVIFLVVYFCHTVNALISGVRSVCSQNMNVAARIGGGKNMLDISLHHDFDFTVLISLQLHESQRLYLLPWNL